MVALKDPPSAVLNKDDLINWFQQGEKPPEAFRIGTEHEKFAFYTDNLSPVPYEGDKGIRALLECLQAKLGWQPVFDEAALIGLAGPDGQGSISLEPGGQFELSGAPLKTLHETCSEANTHLKIVRECAEPLGIGFLGLGMTPDWSLQEIPVMPKSRYAIMRRYMPKVGTRGLDMMFRTATIQVNLDFSSEADMARKMRVATALQPLATALFANSPFTEGKPNGFLSERAHIWNDTDNSRSGLIPAIFNDNFGYETYVDWALKVPMYFVRRQGHYHDASGQSFEDFMQGQLPACLGLRPTLNDWEDHLSTLFPHVRLKRFLEMRGADGGPWRRICALPAFWTGLLYHPNSLNAAWDMIKGWTFEDCLTLSGAVAKEGLQSVIQGRRLLDWARDSLALSHQGLKARGYTNARGEDETVYLEALEEIVHSGSSPAEQLLARYERSWQNSVKPVYEENCF
jgi:glutamate--cysteine ligase